jgi:hypothetical protein
MPFVFAVVCEARADQETACALADRVFCAEVDWLGEEILDECRRWRGAIENSYFLTWSEVGELARQAGIRAHGHFGCEPAHHDARIARRALRLLMALELTLDGVLLIRDDDRDADRRAGLEQARRESEINVPVVISLAHTKRECWVLAGFDPCSDAETRELDGLRRELNFDPRLAADRLTAKHDHETRSAKRVLAALTKGDREREAECWLRCELRLLETRGASTGLADYLRELRERLVPLFTGERRPQGGG